jgi:hypothetical protein
LLGQDFLPCQGARASTPRRSVGITGSKGWRSAPESASATTLMLPRSIGASRAALSEAASVGPSGYRHDCPGYGTFRYKSLPLSLSAPEAWCRWPRVEGMSPFAAVLARARLATDDRALTLVYGGKRSLPWNGTLGMPGPGVRLRRVEPRLGGRFWHPAGLVSADRGVGRSPRRARSTSVPARVPGLPTDLSVHDPARLTLRRVWEAGPHPSRAIDRGPRVRPLRRRTLRASRAAARVCHLRCCSGAAVASSARWQAGMSVGCTPVCSRKPSTTPRAPVEDWRQVDDQRAQTVQPDGAPNLIASAATPAGGLS